MERALVSYPLLKEERVHGVAFFSDLTWPLPITLKSAMGLCLPHWDPRSRILAPLLKYNEVAVVYAMCAKLFQSCPALCHPLDCNSLGFSVCRISQARILEWVAISFSRESSQPRDRTCIPYVLCIGRKVLYHQCHRSPMTKASAKTDAKEFILL